MFVQRRAVEPREPARIGRKVAGHPFENHPQARTVAAIDETREFRSAAIGCVRRELTQYLVAPRATEWMPHHRQQFDVCESESCDIRYELIAELPPMQRAPTFVGHAPPGSHVHLVDRDRGARGVG